MSLAAGFGWLKCRQDYQQHFGVAVPDWICCYDLPQRTSLVRVACAWAGSCPIGCCCPMSSIRVAGASGARDRTAGACPDSTGVADL